MQAARIGFCLGSHFGCGQYQNGMINSGLSSEDHAETNLQNILQTGFTPSVLDYFPRRRPVLPPRALASQRMLTPYAVSLQINTPTSRVPQHKCTRSGDPESMPEGFFFFCDFLTKTVVPILLPYKRKL